MEEPSLFGFKANKLDGQAFDFGSLRGKVVLIMNSAAL